MSGRSCGRLLYFRQFTVTNICFLAVLLVFALTLERRRQYPSENSPRLRRQGYLDILCTDALRLNMDRHTQNYGILRDRPTGGILGMAPNFDNNIALTSRGRGPDPRQTNGLLIGLFMELLEKRGLAYQAPTLEEATLREIAQAMLPEEDIGREYAASMAAERWQRLEHRLEHRQGLSSQFLSLSQR